MERINYSIKSEQLELLPKLIIFKALGGFKNAEQNEALAEKICQELAAYMSRNELDITLNRSNLQLQFVENAVRKLSNNG